MKAALYSLNTIAINVMYIDRYKIMHIHYNDIHVRPPVPIVMKTLP